MTAYVARISLLRHTVTIHDADCRHAVRGRLHVLEQLKAQTLEGAYEEAHDLAAETNRTVQTCPCARKLKLEGK